MIDFSTLQGLTIPEGVVTQIADASGRVLWSAGGGKVILEVEKITSDTYAGETTYTGEEFILLDIYPKTTGTVSVTYGGLTKTITDTSGAEEPNAQQVFFGTFNGVSDSVTTPTSGTLTIKGDYYAFGVGTFIPSSSTKGLESYAKCIISVSNWGDVYTIPNDAFRDCDKMTAIEIPKSVVSIGSYAFFGIESLTSVTLSEGLETIGAYAFSPFVGKEITIPSSVISIDVGAFTTSTFEKVTILSNTPPALGDYTDSDTGEKTYSNFGVPGADNFTLEQIIVPKGCGNTYKTATGWSTYANYIVEAS